MGRRLAYLIGNQAFGPGSGLDPLKGPRNDVEALQRVLGDPEVGGFEVTCFLDRPSNEIRLALNRALNVAERGDTLLIFYAGHGKLDRRGKLCLATADTEEDALYASSIPAQHICDLVDHSQADCTVLLLDCCYSGAFVGHRGDVASEFASLTRGASGLYVLTASTAVQTAKETEGETDGVMLGRFTAEIVQGIESGRADRDGDGAVALSDLNRHLRETLRGQTPQFWAHESSGDPIIAHVRQRETPEEKRLKRLGAWYADGAIPDVLYQRIVGALDGDAEPRVSALVGRILDQPDARPAALIAAWRGATEPRRGPPPAPPPPRQERAAPEDPVARRLNLLDRWYAEGAIPEGEFGALKAAAHGEGDARQVALVRDHLDRPLPDPKALRAAWKDLLTPAQSRPEKPPETERTGPFASSRASGDTSATTGQDWWGTLDQARQGLARGARIATAVVGGIVAAIFLLLLDIISSDFAFLVVAVLAGVAINYALRRRT